MSNLLTIRCTECNEFVYGGNVICSWCGADIVEEADDGIRITHYFKIWTDLITKPLSAFDSLSSTPDIRGGRIIFYLTGIMMATHLFFIISYIENIGFSANAGILNLLVWLFLYAFFIILVPLFFLIFFEFCWKITTMIITNFLKILGGSPDYAKTKSALGYGMLPVLLVWAFTLLFRIVIPLDSAPSDLTYSFFKQVLIISQLNFPGILITYAILLGWVWSFILTNIGIRKVNKASYLEVFVATVLPFGLFFVLYL